MLSLKRNKCLRDDWSEQKFTFCPVEKSYLVRKWIENRWIIDSSDFNSENLIRKGRWLQSCHSWPMTQRLIIPWLSCSYRGGAGHLSSIPLLYMCISSQLPETEIIGVQRLTCTWPNSPQCSVWFTFVTWDRCSQIWTQPVKLDS